MNIDDLTLGQIKQLTGLFQKDKADNKPFTPHLGKRCIIRTYASGVFCGIPVSQDGRMVEIKDCRRLWSWKATESVSLSSVAVNGVDPTACRFPETVPTMTVLDALEIIPASEKSLKSIDACPVTEQR